MDPIIITRTAVSAVMVALMVAAFAVRVMKFMKSGSPVAVRIRQATAKKVPGVEGIVVAIVLIVVAVALLIVFKDQIGKFMDKVFGKLDTKTDALWS